jgi:hypothetical protein
MPLPQLLRRHRWRLIIWATFLLALVAAFLL